MTENKLNELKIKIIELLQDFKENKNIQLLRLKSSEAVYLILDNNFDFCYLGGLHDYYSVMTDILLYWPKIKKGGILAGYGFSSLESDYLLVVPIAVNEFARKIGVNVFITGEKTTITRSWYIFKP